MSKNAVAVAEKPVKKEKPVVVKEAPKVAWTYVPLKPGKGACDGQKADGSFWSQTREQSSVHAALDNQRALCGRSLQKQETLTRLTTNWVWVKEPVTCKRCLAKA